MRIFKAVGAGIGITVSFFYLGCGSIQVAEASHGTGAPPLTIATKQLPSAIIGKPYVAVLDAAGGTPGYKWSVTGGELPFGVSLASSTGILSGTPTTSGNFSISLALADSGNPSQSKSSTVTLTVATAPLKIAVSAITSAIVGGEYSQTLQASGGTAPYGWHIASGTLPTGLSLASSTGTISGTPAASGTAKFIATVRDSGRPTQTSSVSMSIIVAATPLKLTTLALSSGVIGTAYSQTLQASGGTQAYTWSMASGNLPAGLSLSSTGIISGTPMSSGVASFTVNLSDHSSPVQTISQPFVINVTSTPLTIATPVLPSVTVGTPYSQTLKASGGTVPYTWSIPSGSLPAGLKLAPSTGLISGVPTTIGTSTFTAMVVDGSSPAQSLSVAIKIAVAPSPVTIVALILPSVALNQPYSQTLRATGGVLPYTWSITSGRLPTGLTLAATTGTISGTATTGGSSSFTVTVTDSSNPAQTASAIKSVTINSSPLTVIPPVLPSVTVGTPYSKALAATGGVGPYVWSITSGSLPRGLSLAGSAGTISGVPTASGVSTFTATVTDSGSPTQSAPALAAIVVAPTLLAITSSQLSSSTVGASYSQSLQAAGGSVPYTWTVSAGSLPAGLSLSPSTGTISGVPTTSGKSTFTVTVADNSSPAQQTSATSTISITPTLAPPTTLAPLVLSIVTGALPPSTVGSSYTQALQASGGTGSYTWAIASGQLPAGLSLSPSGIIAGVPSSVGSSSFTVSVTDSGTPAQSQSATLSIASAASASPLSIVSATLASGTPGTSYSQVLMATGGTPAYTWSITSGALPAGLTLAATTGTITGTPTSTGTSTFTASVHDNGNPSQAVAAATTITVTAEPVAGPGGTWFIRTDGGTRYSANVPTGQCDGQADTAYPGSGTNQHCAFNDVRYMWMDGTYGNSAWVMSGGDTLVIRGCAATPYQQNADAPHCRIGWDKATGNDSQNFWCAGVTAPWGCSMPAPPSGTSGQHTRILGACAFGTYSCNPVIGYPYTANNLTQLFGGFVSGAVMFMNGSQYVDVEGLEITSHNGRCSRVGAVNYPAGCSTSVPVGDFANWGIIFSNTTSNILLQDVYIHGLTTVGIAGPIGGPVTLTRVSIDFNAFAGWNMDDGHTTPDAPGSSITQSYVTMVGNGCLEQYPIANPQFPALSCWDSNSGGFGDSWSGQDTELDSFTCDHCYIAYNTKDAATGPHTRIKNFSMTNSVTIGNMGQSGKWAGTANSTTLYENNLVVGNCLRMSQQLPGAMQNFSQSTGLGGSYLSNFCRAAGDLFSFFTDANSSVLIANNTFTSYQPTFFDFGCATAGACVTSPYVIENNIFLGYTTSLNYYPNSGQAPGLFYLADPTVPVVSSYNIEYGMRNGDPCGGNIICSDPLLVNEPSQGSFPPETSLDNFNFHLTSGSPAIRAGKTITGLQVDYYDLGRPTPPAIGAVEP